MNRRAKRRVIILCVSVALLLVVSIISYLVATATTHETRIIGARKNAKGEITQRIICEVTTTKSAPLPGPHGWTRQQHTTYDYFLEENGKPRRELSFLHNAYRPLVHNEEWRTVSDSSLWVAPAFTESGQFEVFVFDSTKLLHHRKLNVIATDSQIEYSFENGNRTLVYRSPEGFKAYDVINDKIVEWKN